MRCELKFKARWNPARTTVHRMTAYRGLPARVLVHFDHVASVCIRLGLSVFVVKIL